MTSPVATPHSASAHSAFPSSSSPTALSAFATMWRQQRACGFELATRTGAQSVRTPGILASSSCSPGPWATRHRG